MQLCLKVNKEQRKCHVNCVGRNVWASGRYIMTDVFAPSGESESVASRESSLSAILGASAGVGWVERPVLSQYSRKEARKSMAIWKCIVTWCQLEDIVLSIAVPDRLSVSIFLCLSLSLTYTHTNTHTTTKQQQQQQQQQFWHFVVNKRRIYIFMNLRCHLLFRYTVI